MANQEIVNRSINVFIESGQAQKVYDTLIAKEKQLNDELAKTADPKKIQALNDQLNKLSEPISRAAKKLSGELAPSLRDNQALAKQLNNELGRQFDPKKAQQLQQINSLIKQQKAEINGLASAQNNISKENGFTRMLDTAKGFVVGNIIAKATAVVHDFFSTSIDEAIEADEKTQKFKATLDNLGRSDAFKRLTDSANEMQKRFKFLDNDDIVQVFNKLIDFGKLTEAQIKQITPVIIDFSVKQKISVQEASSVIIKALAGNGKGLKEYGVDIKDAKTETERFGVIMTTLKDKVNGAGDAFEKTAAGGIAVAKQQFKDLKEEVGTGLIPVLNSLLKAFNFLLIGAVDVASRIKGAFKDIAAGTGLFGVSTDNALAIAEQQSADNIEEAHNRANLFLAKSEADIKKRIDRVNQLLTTAQKALDAQRSLRKKGFATDEEVGDNVNSVQILKEELDTLKSIADQRKLGIDQVDIEAEKLKKILEDYKALAEALAAMKFARQADLLSPLDKEVAETDQKFTKLKLLAHGNRDKLKQIDTEYYEQLFAIQLKFSRLELQEYFANKKAEEQRAQELVNKLSAIGVQTSTNDKLKGVFELVGQDNAAKVELDILKAHGKEKLDLQKEQLQKEEDAEVLGIENTAAARGASENTVLNMIALTREKFRQKQLELEIQHYAEVAGKIMAVVQQAFQAVQQIAQIQTDHENAELAADEELNKKKEANLDTRLKTGLLTQLAHDREVQKIEKEQQRREKDIKDKQFRRNQAMSIIQTNINGAMAAINALTVQPFYVGIALAAIAAASTIAEVAYIRGQKPPDFGDGGLYGDGGKTSGQAHSNGGNPIIDGRTGKKIGEIEHDEGIINKRSMRDKNEYTISGTVSQIGSLLNRLHGGIHWEPGAKLVPAWRTVQPARINIPNIQRYYAAGGTFTASTTGQSLSNNAQSAQARQNQQVNEMLMTTLTNMQSSIDNLHDTFSDIKKNGIKAFTVLSEQEAQQDRITAIRNDATLKG